MNLGRWCRSFYGVTNAEETASSSQCYTATVTHLSVCAGDAVDVTASEFFLMKGISGFLNFWCGVPSNEGGVFNNCLRSIYFKIRKMLNVKKKKMDYWYETS